MSARIAIDRVARIARRAALLAVLFVTMAGGQGCKCRSRAAVTVHDPILGSLGPPQPSRQELAEATAYARAVALGDAAASASPSVVRSPARRVFLTFWVAGRKPIVTTALGSTFADSLSHAAQPVRSVTPSGRHGARSHRARRGDFARRHHRRRATWARARPLGYMIVRDPQQLGFVLPRSTSRGISWVKKTAPHWRSTPCAR